MLSRNHSRFLVLLCLASIGSVSVLPCFGQRHDLSDADLPALLARVKTNTASNDRLIQQYTSDEVWHNRNFDKNGKTTVDESAKYEHVFLEGLPYRKKVEENGKPLVGKEAAAEEKRYEEAVKERRAMTTRQKWLSLHKTWHFSLPMCCLTTLFENHVVGHEQVDGRDMLVVDSVPRPDAMPKNDEERTALNWRQRAWIDIGDEIFARIDCESLSDQNHTAKGMTIRLDFDRTVDVPSIEGHPARAVWLLKNTTSNFRFKLLWIGATGTTEQTWSNFKKFHVDMRLLEDTMEPADGNAATSLHDR
jgi:hypothetical protein